MTDAAPPTGQVVLLAGPSGSGKSHLARASGLPVLCLDHFYKDGDDPSLPRHPELGIVDWDHPQAWDADGAFRAIQAVCETGAAAVPRYDIATDRATGTTPFSRAGHVVFVAEGVFVAELVQRCRDAGLLADALVIDRPTWTNFARRLTRDLAERRKPPWTLLRRGRALLRAEHGLVDALEASGCRRLPAADVAAALRAWDTPAQQASVGDPPAPQDSA